MTLLEKKILIHSLRPAVLTGVIEAVGMSISSLLLLLIIIYYMYLTNYLTTGDDDTSLMRFSYSAL